MRFARMSLIAVAGALIAFAADAASVQGDWMTPTGGARVHIAPCGAGLCGTVVWLKETTDKATGQPRTDAHNPDPALRSNPMMGLRFLRDLKPSGADRWSGGTIYDPASGKTYDSKMMLEPDGTLTVDGCIGLICRAQIWTPAH